jgi:hypothetical protein
MPTHVETHKRGGLQHLPQTKRDLLRRIRTVRGHLAGIEEMIEDEEYCVEILKQIAAGASVARPDRAKASNQGAHADVPHRSDSIGEGRGED